MIFFLVSPRQARRESEDLKACFSWRSSLFMTMILTDLNEPIGRSVCVCACVAFVNSVECSSSLNAPFSSADTPAPPPPHSPCPLVETASPSPVLEPSSTVKCSLSHKAKSFFNNFAQALLAHLSHFILVSSVWRTWCHLQSRSL